MMAPRWPQDGQKMAPRWLKLEGDTVWACRFFAKRSPAVLPLCGLNTAGEPEGARFGCVKPGAGKARFGRGGRVPKGFLGSARPADTQTPGVDPGSLAGVFFATFLDSFLVSFLYTFLE